jgi:hypothetical protein
MEYVLGSPSEVRLSGDLRNIVTRRLECSEPKGSSGSKSGPAASSKESIMDDRGWGGWRVCSRSGRP